MTLRERIASMLRHLADRIDPRPYSHEEALRLLQINSAGFDGAWAIAVKLAERLNASSGTAEDDGLIPLGPRLLKAIRVAFIEKGTTLNAWCEARRINRGNVTLALLGGWRGPKGRAIARRVAKAAGVGEIRWNQ